jgi:multiple sugar transport system substrate-binding protein
MRKCSTFLILFIFSFCLVIGAWASGQKGEQAGTEAGTGIVEGTLKIFMMTAGSGRGFGDMAKDFEAAHPTIKVEETLYNPAKGYDTKAELELAAGGGTYDVIWSPWRAYRRWVQNDWIQEVTSYINDPKMTDDAKFKFNDFLGGSVNAITIDGKLYGLPILNATVVLYYRKDIFAQQGLPERAPDSWDELMDFAAKAKTDEVGGIGMRGSRARGGVMWHFPMVMYSYGGRIMKDFPKDMHPVFNSPEVLAAAEYYADLLNSHGFKGTVSAHWQDVVTAYQQGKTAMAIDGHPLAGRFLDPEKSVAVGKTGFGLVPKGPVTRWPPFACHAISIPAAAKNKPASWEYLKWCLSTETQLRSGVEFNEVSATRKSVLADPRFIEKYNWGDGEFLAVVSEQFDKHVKAFYRPMNAQWGDVEDATAIAMSKILAREGSAQKALDEANERIYEVNKEAGYYDK